MDVEAYEIFPVFGALDKASAMSAAQNRRDPAPYDEVFNKKGKYLAAFVPSSSFRGSGPWSSVACPSPGRKLSEDRK